MDKTKPKRVAVIVAHPDDETLWAGGTILSHQSWQWFILCLTRKNDTERAGKFYQALEALGAIGIMGELDDGPDQKPLNMMELKEGILRLLPSTDYDLIISHHPNGEYTRHLRHEETGKAVIQLWHRGQLNTRELWTFAYEDGGKQYYPRAIKANTLYHVLPKHTWERKYKIITEIFGFNENSWEAETTPREESFMKFPDSNVAMQWLNNK